MRMKILETYITLMTQSKPLHLHLSEAIAHCLLDTLVISSYIAWVHFTLLQSKVSQNTVTLTVTLLDTQNSPVS